MDYEGFRREAEKAGLALPDKPTEPYYFFDLNHGPIRIPQNPVAAYALIVRAKKYARGSCGEHNALLDLVAERKYLDNRDKKPKCIFWARLSWKERLSEITLREYLELEGFKFNDLLRRDDELS